MPRPYSTSQRARAFPTKGSEAKGRAYAPPDAGLRGKRRFIKCYRQKRIEEGEKITPKV
jgi:hypothetical protein